MRTPTVRLHACIVCGADVLALSQIEPLTDAPEMLQFPPGAWVGFVQGDRTLEMVVFCSTGCLAERCASARAKERAEA